MHVFVAGVVTIVAFLFQDNLIVRVVQVLVFAGLATLAGKRIRWLYFLIMVSSITFFNLLTPVGRVLAEIGPLRVTEGALRQGLMKGFAIVGLVFISLFAVRPDLRLPGAFGGVLARLFYYFERVLDTRARVSAAHLVESVDAVLMELYPPGPTDPVVAAADHEGVGRDGGDCEGGAAREIDATDGAVARTDLTGGVVMALVVVVNVVFAIVY